MPGPSGQILYAWGGYAAAFPLSATAQVESALLSGLLEAGVWQVESVTIVDEAGNSRSVSQAELEAAGLPHAVTVNY